MMPKVIGNDSLIARVNEVQGCMYRQSNELRKLNKAVRRYKEENAKLRALLMMAYKAATEPDCDECCNEHSCRNNELSYCVMWVELEQKMRGELGIDVDG